MNLIGKKYQSLKTNVIYEVKIWFNRDQQYQCEFRIMNSLRIQVCMISEQDLKNKTLFREL